MIRAENSYGGTKTCSQGASLKLTFTSRSLGKNLDDKLMLVFLFFPGTEIICMKCQILFPGKIKKNEAHRGSGDCYVHVFVQPCFHGPPMHTWCCCLSQRAALSTLYSTQGTSSMI